MLQQSNMTTEEKENLAYMQGDVKLAELYRKIMEYEEMYNDCVDSHESSDCE